MKTLFNDADRAAIRARVETLAGNATPRWGKMNTAQMFTHCRRALEAATGDAPRKRLFIGRILGPFVRVSALGERPFSRNSPTDPAFVVSDEREFNVERQGLLDLIERFAARGEAAESQMHSFFGKLSAKEWGVLAHKHLDHHLQQFGA